jgi:hypothetical protein
MLAKRIIPCLDVDKGRVVKGVKFQNLRDAGDPVEVAKSYEEQSADELVFLDITASAEERKIMIEVVQRVAETIFIPFHGGGWCVLLGGHKEAFIRRCGQGFHKHRSGKKPTADLRVCQKVWFPVHSGSHRRQKVRKGMGGLYSRWEDTHRA